MVNINVYEGYLIYKCFNFSDICECIGPALPAHVGGCHGAGRGVASWADADKGDDKTMDKPGRFLGDLSLMKMKLGTPICAAFQKGRCDKEVQYNNYYLLEH